MDWRQGPDLNTPFYLIVDFSLPYDTLYLPRMEHILTPCRLLYDDPGDCLPGMETFQALQPYSSPLPVLRSFVEEQWRGHVS